MSAVPYRIRTGQIKKQQFGSVAERHRIVAHKHEHGLLLPGTMEAVAEMGLLLDRASIDWWLSYGALLGFVRDGRFIDGDVDVDVVVAEDTDCRAVEAALRNGGAALLNRISYAGAVTNENYWLKGVYIDIYYAKQHGKKRVDYSRFSGCILLLEHDRQKAVAQTTAGISLRVPSDPEPYLSKLYGSTWRIPDQNWCWYLSQTPVEIWGDPFRLAWCYYRREIRRA